MQHSEKSLASDIIFMSIAEQISDAMIAANTPDDTKDFLTYTMQGLRDIVPVLYEKGSLNTLEPSSGVMILVTNSGSLVTLLQLDNILADDAVFTEAPTLTDSATFWGVVHDAFNNDRTDIACWAIIARLGRERLTVWRDAMNQKKGSIAVPVLIAVTGIRNAVIDDDSDEVCGLFTVAPMPKVLPELKPMPVDDADDRPITIH